MAYKTNIFFPVVEAKTSIHCLVCQVWVVKYCLMCGNPFRCYHTYLHIVDWCSCSTTGFAKKNRPSSQVLLSSLGKANSATRCEIGRVRHPKKHGSSKSFVYGLKCNGKMETFEHKEESPKISDLSETRNIQSK